MSTYGSPSGTTLYTKAEKNTYPHKSHQLHETKNIAEKQRDLYYE